MTEEKKEKSIPRRLSPLEIAVSGAITDMVTFFVDFDIVRGIIPYQDAKDRDKIRAYKEMVGIRDKYPKNSMLWNKSDEAEKFVRPYLKVKDKYEGKNKK
jgi:hypothetical protein